MLKEAIIHAVESHAHLCTVSMRPSNKWSISSKDHYTGWSNVNVRGRGSCGAGGRRVLGRGLYLGEVRYLLDQKAATWDEAMSM